MRTVDLNADIGESFGRYTIGMDKEVLKYITSANIACGFHAGDPYVMQKTIDLAMKNDVKIGAHPGYDDLRGFGRRKIVMNLEELYADLVYQIGALKTMVETQGGRLQHVKPHGALYNDAYKDKRIASIIIKAIKAIDNDLYVLSPEHSKLSFVAKENNIKVAKEVFSDRAYADDLSLVSRNQKGAVFTSSDQSLNQVKNIILNNKVLTINNIEKELIADSICVHGDNKQAIIFLESMHKLFNKEKINLQAFSE